MAQVSRHERMMKKRNDPGGVACPVCGKVRYATRRLARLAAQRLQGRGHGKLFPYQDDRCGDFWHLTSWPRSQTDRFRT